MKNEPPGGNNVLKNTYSYRQK